MSASRRDFLAWLPAALQAVLGWRPRPAPAAAAEHLPPLPPLSCPGEPYHLGSVTTLVHDTAASRLCAIEPGLLTTYTYEGRGRPPVPAGGNA